MMKKTIGQEFSKLCLLIPSFIALSGIAVLVYQICFLATRGQWKPLSLRVALDIILPAKFFQWIQNPGPWSILEKIISASSNFPLCLFLMTSGLVLLLLVAEVIGLFSKFKKNKSLNENTFPENQHFPELLKVLSSQNGHNNIASEYSQ